MAQGKDHIWGGIPLEAAQDESLLDAESFSRYVGTRRISLKKQEEIKKGWLMSGWKAPEKKYLDFGCLICSRRLALRVIYVLFVALLLAGIVAIAVQFLPQRHHSSGNYDSFALALQKALLFFDAQKSGLLPNNYTISYRRTSGLQDGVLAGGSLVDLKGGFYDSGKNIKFGFPAAYTTTLLSWSVIEYSAKYRAAGELDHVKEIIRWSTDYLLKTFNFSAPVVDQIFAQVGEGTVTNPPTQNDGYCWQRPEDMRYARVVATCTSAPELGAETAAALAAASIVFRTDREYSTTLIQGAQKIFAFATHPGKTKSYTASGAPDAASFYPSSGYNDEHIWAATWLFFATGNWSYLNTATDETLAGKAQAEYSAGNSYGVFDWDNKLLGAQILLTRLLILLDPGFPALRNSQQYTNDLMCQYVQQNKMFAVTEGGLVLFKGVNSTTPLRYTAPAAFLSALYADYLQAADIPGWKCGNTLFLAQALRNFATSQVEYILGRNPERMSFVVGLGERYPEFVDHRAASIPADGKTYGCTEGFKWRDSTRANPNVLEGAMVGGPDAEDRFQDRRGDANSTEPTIASNAGLVAALVAMAGCQQPSSSCHPLLLDTNALFSSLPPPP